MQSVTTIGLDIAKSVFQVHGIDAEGNVVFRQQLKRARVLVFFKKLSPCLVGIEACASSHYWGRELQAIGHTVRLMLPAYVKPYVKRQKNDAADAEAICEAVQRPSMRFVPIKGPEQQACLVLHRTRHLFVRQQTAVINSIRAHLAEFGIVAPVGRGGVEQLVGVIDDAKDDRIPALVRTCLTALRIQLDALKEQIRILDRRLAGWHKTNETCRRLDAIPGVGPALATALVASVADPKVFRSGRDFSAWIGLVPQQTRAAQHAVHRTQSSHPRSRHRRQRDRRRPQQRRLSALSEGSRLLLNPSVDSFRSRLSQLVPRLESSSRVSAAISAMPRGEAKPTWPARWRKSAPRRRGSGIGEI